MRHYLKSLILTVASLYIAYKLVPTIILGYDPKNLLLIISSFWLISHLIQPIFSLILLPINLLTMGFVSLILNIALVFALLNFLPGLVISAYFFPGANIQGIIFPSINFNTLTTMILVATIITFSQKILHLIFE